MTIGATGVWISASAAAVLRWCLEHVADPAAARAAGKSQSRARAPVGSR